MPLHTLSSSDFAKDVSAALRAAEDGPVIIKDGERPAFALLNIRDYRRMADRSEMSLLEVMDEIACGDCEFEAPRVEIRGRSIDLE